MRSVSSTREIFEQHCYEHHGVTVKNGDVILDVGTHIGMFALSVMERFRGVKMVCVEPVPNTRACLVRNVTDSPWRNLHEITILASVIGSTNGEATISYFPRAPSSSTLHLRDKRRESGMFVEMLADKTTFWQIWKQIQIWKWNKPLALLLLSVYPWRRRLFTRFVGLLFDNPITLRCEVRTLSNIIRQQGLEHIDLLKIDVEGTELEVLQGIEEQHWPLIQQVAVEMSATHKGALMALGDRLRSLGFTKVTVESMLGGTPVLDDPIPCMLYAVHAAH